MQTIRRDKLQRDIEAGKMEAKCDMVLTDDFAFDGSVNFQKSDWLPAEVVPYAKRQYRDDAHRVCYFDPYDFRYSTGRAYRNLDGTISFTICANHYYTLRYRDTRTEAQKNTDAIADRLHEMDVYTR